MTAYKLFIQCSMPYITCKTIVNWKLETDYRWRLLQRTIWLLENCKSSLQSTTIYIYISTSIYPTNPYPRLYIQQNILYATQLKLLLGNQQYFIFYWCCMSILCATEYYEIWVQNIQALAWKSYHQTVALIHMFTLYMLISNLDHGYKYLCIVETNALGAF